MIDLRSDTFTKPSQEMRNVIANAEVGDDIFGEDPTVNRLQEIAAEITGKEAALYTTSGTQANQVAVKVHTNPGEEIIVEENAHIAYYESGAPAFISNVMVKTIPGNKGIMTAEQVVAALRPGNLHFPETTLVTLENTHNKAGGNIYPIEEIVKIREITQKNGILMHLDGARIFNASVASGISVKEYTKYFDSLSFCLSKGLGAPVGSLLCGSNEFIQKALRIRKILGGGMRQAGIIASAGIFALENNIPKLAEDHVKAKRLAQILSNCPVFSINPDDVETNIVMVDVAGNQKTASAVVEELGKKGIQCLEIDSYKIRMVTHLDVSLEEINMVEGILKKMY